MNAALRGLCGAVLAVVSCSAAAAQSAKDSPVRVEGAVTTAQSWTLAELRALPSETVSIAQRTDKGLLKASFTGVLLWALVDKAGLVNGPQKNAFLRHVIVVSAGDGYTVALSEGEIDPKLEGKAVLIAYARDGKPLDSARLVVPGDHQAARSVHGVTAIEIK